MCQNIDFLRTEEETDEEVDEFGEIHGEMFARKDEILNEKNQENLGLTKIDVLRNSLKEVIAFDAICKERGAGEVLYSFIMSLV